MKKILGILAITLAIAIPQAADKTDKAGKESTSLWMTDYKAALKKAKELDRPVVMDFTGSDWCPPCKALHRDVFAKKQFKNYAKGKLVLLELDFPTRKKLPAALKEQNQGLAREYKIQGYPTIIVLNPNGKMVAKEAGYQWNTPQKFIKWLEGVQKKG